MDLLEAKQLVTKSENNHKFYYELDSGAKAYFVCDKCHEMEQIKMPEFDFDVKSVIAHGVCKRCSDE